MPVTEFLLSHKESETQSPYHDFVGSEEFLGSHVIRIPPESSLQDLGKEATSLRETKGKARQYITVNGRTVIVRDVHVYTNKGFKSLNQAQLLNDAIYVAGAAESPPWLIYYISRPLLGDPEPLSSYAIQPVTVPVAENGASGSVSPGTGGPFHSLMGLLTHFPVVSRQVQPGMDKQIELCEKELLALTLMSSLAEQQYTHASSVSSRVASQEDPRSTATNGKNEMRAAIEALINSCILQFQAVDKHSLAFMYNAANMDAAQVESLVERHLMQQLHSHHVFPRVCAMQRAEDNQLDACLRQLSDVDLSQVGLSLEDVHDRHEATVRVKHGVETFSKMTHAESALEMLNILLETEQRLSKTIEVSNGITQSDTQSQEKPVPPSAMNADTLVSLLLLIVIRSPVRQLHARLCYMRDFIFTLDVENGEAGYALSTFEAVLMYLSTNSSGLRKASRLNRSLWQAVKDNNIQELESILDPSDVAVGQQEADALDRANADVIPMGNKIQQSPSDNAAERELSQIQSGRSRDDVYAGLAHVFPFMNDAEPGSPRLHRGSSASLQAINISHVFPFLAQPLPAVTAVTTSKSKKRVSLQERSLSSSSTHSIASYVSSIRSGGTAGAETTSEHLAQTQDKEGNSILMMAVKNSQSTVLSYLLERPDYFPISTVLDDQDNDETTLLSAAVQIGDRPIIEKLLRFITRHVADRESLRLYLSRQDVRQRTVAHYLFNAPYLIGLVAELPWQTKDCNGQTPLLALCRSYDHEDYRKMVATALTAASRNQGDGQPLHLDEHVDNKGNTLLHVVNDSRILHQLLTACDVDPNAMNTKHFTPIMVASKFARVDSVRIFFNDLRTDLQARDLRGLTAVELAKDDEVRNRIDDMILLATPPARDGRSTAIVRAFFVEDASVRLIIKSGAPNSRSSITVNTCRRTVSDFENLAKWLALESPASWIPSISNLRTPFQIPSKPSRATLRDIQVRLDNFLTTMLAHPTFATHEMLWEFILVPDIDPDMLAERARRKAAIRVDKLREEYEPVTDGGASVEIFVDHAHEQVVKLHDAVSRVLRFANAQRNVFNELTVGVHAITALLTTTQTLPNSHKAALTRYKEALKEQEFGAHAQLAYMLSSSLCASSAVLRALSRPSHLIDSMAACREAIEKHTAAATRTQRWPLALGLLDEARQRSQQEAAEKARKAERELQTLGRELSYTQQTVASELAGWQEWHARTFRQGLKDLARRMVVQEKARLDAMRRAWRQIEKTRMP